MTDELKPLIVSVPSSSGTGSGLVSDDKRPVYIHALEPVTIVAMRALKSFVDALLGSAFITNFAPALFDTHSFWQSAKVSLLAACVVGGVTALRTISELLAKWDQTHPTLSA